MKLITELNEEVKLTVLEEETTGKKTFKVEGIFLQGAIKNKNGRRYPVHILENEVNRYNREYVGKKRAYGELGHPAGPTINPERISHVVTELRRDGDNFIGKAQILNTPYGDIVRNIMNDGCSLGVSSRGLGSLKEAADGIQEVQDDFYLATAADIVTDPSAPDAFVQGIMEGREWIYESGVFKEVDLEHVKAVVNDAASRRQTEKAILESWNYLFNSFTEGYGDVPETDDEMYRRIDRKARKPRGETFKSGDKVYMKPDYVGSDAGGRFTLSDWDPIKKRGWAGDKDGRGWYVGDYQITKKRAKPRW